MGYTNAGANVQLAFWLHLGTASAVIVYYREKFRLLFDFSRPESKWLWKFLFLTTLGTLIVALPIRLFLIELIPSSLGPFLNLIVALFLVITGLLLSKWDHLMDLSLLTVEDLPDKKYFIAGLFQGVAAIPGISRSGITVSYFLYEKLGGEEAFKGSFWMSVPASLGAVSLEIIIALSKHESILPGGEVLGVFVGVLLAFVVGFFTLGALIKIARKYSFSKICYLLAFIIVLGVFIEVSFG